MLNHERVAQHPGKARCSYPCPQSLLKHLGCWLLLHLRHLARGCPQILFVILRHLLGAGSPFPLPVPPATAVWIPLFSSSCCSLGPQPSRMAGNGSDALCQLRRAKPPARTATWQGAATQSVAAHRVPLLSAWLSSLRLVFPSHGHALAFFGPAAEPGPHLA